MPRLPQSRRKRRQKGVQQQAQAVTKHLRRVINAKTEKLLRLKRTPSSSLAEQARRFDAQRKVSLELAFLSKRLRWFIASHRYLGIR